MFVFDQGNALARTGCGWKQVGFRGKQQPRILRLRFRKTAFLVHGLPPLRPTTPATKTCRRGPRGRRKGGARSLVVSWPFEGTKTKVDPSAFRSLSLCARRDRGSQCGIRGEGCVSHHRRFQPHRKRLRVAKTGSPTCREIGWRASREYAQTRCEAARAEAANVLRQRTRWRLRE